MRPFLKFFIVLTVAFAVLWTVPGPAWAGAKLRRLSRPGCRRTATGTASTYA